VYNQDASFERVASELQCMLRAYRHIGIFLTRKEFRDRELFELVQSRNDREVTRRRRGGSAWTILCLEDSRGKSKFCLSAEPAIHKEVRNCSSTFYSASSEE